MRRLIIPSHMRARYRERVHEDRWVGKRSKDEIDIIIGLAIYESGILDKRVQKNSHVLVHFRDPFEGESFGVYYVVLNPADENDGRIVCETIKDVPEVVHNVLSVDSYVLSQMTRDKRTALRWQREKNRFHYSKYPIEEAIPAVT